jgi:hypothetical protein
VTPSWLRAAVCSVALLPVEASPPGLEVSPCQRGVHTWLAPEASLRSARTGYQRAFCRGCPASYAASQGAPARPAPWFGQVGVPVPG